MTSALNANGKRPAENTAQSPPKTLKSDYKGVVAVVVGTEDQKDIFLVHQDLICDRSPFFKAACSKGWAEKKTKTINLPNEHPYIFKMYLQWAYSTTADLAEMATELDSPVDPDGNPLPFSPFIRLCYLWKQSDYLGDAICKNEVMNSLIRQVAKERSQDLYYGPMVRYVYQSTRTDSGLRKWLVDTILPDVTTSFLEENSAELPPRMVFDLLRALVNEHGQGFYHSRPREEDAWKYHE